MILPTVLRRNIVLMFAIQHAKPANILKFEININYYRDTQYQKKEILNIDIPSKKAINMSIFKLSPSDQTNSIVFQYFFKYLHFCLNFN